MRFAIPPTQGKGKIFASPLREWSLTLLFPMIIIPFGICVALTAAWIGYRAAAPLLRDSLGTEPLLEAKRQADKLENTLAELRRSLGAIAESGDITEDSLKTSLHLFFHNNSDLIQEIGFRDAQQNGFLLLRDTADFIRLSAAEASQGLYSPFQQLAAASLQPGQAFLYPPVYFDDPAPASQSRPARTPVMRMALLLPDQSGTLVLGLSLPALCAELSKALQSGPSTLSSAQDNSLRMSFFFDVRGWILFETSGLGGKSFLPDLAREGYLGDLGRAGYDAAFRPWAAHEEFWRMVTEVRSGHAGHMPTPANTYSSANVGATGLLGFAPVAFAPQEGAPAVVQGGIAFFSTSPLPMAAFLRLANYSLVILVGVILLSALLTLFVNKKLARPLKRLAQEVQDLADSGTLAFINAEAASEEQHSFQSSVNVLIAGAMKSRGELERLKREMEQARSRQPVDLSQPGEAPPLHEEFGLVGSSARIKEVRERVRKAARAGTDVLIWGETGTGKELVAAAIHKASPRHEGPYISINCGALDENLLLDALFGHVKGAFTEAKNDRKGAFLSAQGGTLHLDEIANASPKVQQALLRALSVRRIRPLGTDEELEFNTRVVAATNVDLRECVRSGLFREDLYYRLAIISIETPPLRQRKEDIPELAAHCIHEAALALGRKNARLSRGALDLMYANDWPGNVREFKNCLTRALAFVEDDLILAQHITLEQGPSRMRAARSSEGDPQRTDVATGPTQVAETLFPSPPREKFTPAQGEGARAEESPSESGEDGPQAAPRKDLALVPERTGKAPLASAGPPEPRPLAFPPRPQGLERGESGPERTASRPALDKLNERQRRALDFARKNGGISRPQFEEVAGTDVSARTLQNDLRELVELGVLRRIGAGPATRYEPGEARERSLGA